MATTSRGTLTTLRIAAALLLCGWSVPVLSQAPDYRARLDSLFDVLESSNRTMGAVTIRKGDRVIYTRALGYRDSTAAGWIRADSATAYRVGSATKPFTAVMIYQLIDARRLSLEAKLSQFFPRLPSSDSITIRDLLGHTSGLPDYSRGLDVRVAITRDSLLRRIESGAMQFAPRTQRRYNNTNFLLLGYIIERVSGLSYAAQLDRAIARRIGLRRTFVGGPVSPVKNEARSYFYDDAHWALQPDDAIANAGGAGALVSTTSDLTKFLAAIFSGRLISQSSVTEMTTGFNDGTRINGKGLGPFTIPATNKRGHSHDGSIGAFSSLIGYVPSDSLSLALTINGHNYPQNRIFFHVWGILNGTAEPLPSFTPVTLAAETALPLVGVYKADAYGLTITIRRTDSGLEAQTTGQDPFPLTFVGRNRFVFERAGILLEFAELAGGVSPRFTLLQQKAAIPLVRVP